MAVKTKTITKNFSGNNIYTYNEPGSGTYSGGASCSSNSDSYEIKSSGLVSISGSSSDGYVYVGTYNYSTGSMTNEQRQTLYATLTLYGITYDNNQVELKTITNDTFYPTSDQLSTYKSFKIVFNSSGGRVDISWGYNTISPSGQKTSATLTMIVKDSLPVKLNNSEEVSEVTFNTTSVTSIKFDNTVVF